MAKVRDDYDAIADEFSAARTEIWPEMRRFRDLVRGGERVLDVGCGNGRTFRLFEGMAVEYEGIDVSARLIEAAKARVHDLLANFRVASMTALPFETGSFDAVVAVAALHHVPSRERRMAALREAHRVLKPGGWLLMTNWDRWKPRYTWRHLVALASKFFGSDHEFGDIHIPWKDGKTMRYYHAFTAPELRRACKAAGFDVIEHYYVDKKGEKCPWWRGENLITICRKPKG